MQQQLFALNSRVCQRPLTHCNTGCGLEVKNTLSMLAPSAWGAWVGTKWWLPQSFLVPSMPFPPVAQIDLLKETGPSFSANHLVGKT